MTERSGWFLEDLPEHIASKIIGEPMSGCWLWTAALRKGYGAMSWNGHTPGAHIVVYELLVGPIMQGLVLDHLCRNPPCVSPWHLEAVPQRVNLERGAQACGLRTHCPQGHPYDKANTYYRVSGKRQCRAGNRDYRRRLRALGLHAAKP